MSANDATVPPHDTAPTLDTVSMEVEIIRRLGWMTSVADWLYRVGKSFGITKEHILLAGSVIAFAILATGFFMGIKFDRSRTDVMDLNGERFQCVGMARDNATGIYVPIYKKSIDVMRGRG